MCDEFGKYALAVLDQDSQKMEQHLFFPCQTAAFDKKIEFVFREKIQSNC